MSKPREIVDSRQRPLIGQDEKPARGLLRRALTLEAIELVRLAPSPDLEGIIEHFWLVLWDRGGIIRKTCRTQASTSSSIRRAGPAYSG